MRAQRRQAGFSLVEVAAGAVMIVTSLLGATAAILSGASLSNEVARMRAAARAASSVMEDVRATEFADVISTFDGTTVDVAIGESGLKDGTASISVREIANGSSTHLVYEITIDVTFDGATVGERQTIVTYASDRVAGSALSGTTSVPNTTPTAETPVTGNSTQ
jgi:type II secretory pathway pseudopilin PulG